jgi:hypothetical protein
MRRTQGRFGSTIRIGLLFPLGITTSNSFLLSCLRHLKKYYVVISPFLYAIHVLKFTARIDTVCVDVKIQPDVSVQSKHNKKLGCQEHFLMSNGRNPANKQEMPLPYHMLRFIPPRGTPGCLAKLLKTF